MTPKVTFVTGINDKVIFLDKDGNTLITVKKLDDDGNIHLETKTEVFDGPADLLLKQ